jgi:hypothetical protein
MLETATIMGQSDPGVTWKHYARPVRPLRRGSSRPGRAGISWRPLGEGLGRRLLTQTYKSQGSPPSHPTCVTLKGDSAETDAGGGPWRTRLLRLGSYPVTFGDRCDSTAMCLVTFLRTTLTPLTPLFVVTV